MLTHDNKRQTGFKLVSKLLDNKQTAWEELYDTYAPMMYGSILNITGDEKTACNLLEQAFIELRNREMLLRIQASLCVSLVKHCCNITLKYLKMQGLKPQRETLDRNCRLIYFFYFEDMTLTEIATRLAMPELEVLRNLQAEFKDIRKRA
jgi:hypothetical protein